MDFKLNTFKVHNVTLSWICYFLYFKKSLNILHETHTVQTTAKKETQKRKEWYCLSELEKLRLC